MLPSWLVCSPPAVFGVALARTRSIAQRDAVGSSPGLRSLLLDLLDGASALRQQPPCSHMLALRAAQLRAEAQAKGLLSHLVSIIWFTDVKSMVR